MNIKEMLAQAVSRRGDAVAIRYKQSDRWHTLSYHELLARTCRAAEFLAHLGIQPADRVAILRENSAEWPEIYFAVVGLAATAVPVDVKLQEQEVAHILRDSGAKAVIAGAKSYPLLREVERHLPDLHHIILVGGRDLLPGQAKKVKYWDYEELMSQVEEAAGSPARAYDKAAPKDDDVASFVYTSGTTGRQKGAMLTHANFTANVASCQKAIDIFVTDNFLLVLPLHHAFAFTANLLLPIACGSEISLVENLKTVGENTREVSPSVLIGVPLLLEKMYNRIWAGLKENKPAYVLYRIGLRRPVIKGIAQKLGGRLRLVISGGAPCDPELLVNFTRLGIPIAEGYGLTETAPVLTLNSIDGTRPGSVGKPLPDVEIRIADPNPEGIGEILARGPNVMKGYYNNPDATAAAVKDGWFQTGDMGFIDADGYVTITGRKKSLIVNREGKNVYPEEVEHQVCKSPFIGEALAVGYREDGERVGEHVGIIVVPNQEALDAYMDREKKRLTEAELEEFIRREVRQQAAHIAEYKRPRRIQVRWEEFDKTSTGKVKRYLYALRDDVD